MARVLARRIRIPGCCVSLGLRVATVWGPVARRESLDAAPGGRVSIAEQQGSLP
jgi:hypothetical protein